MFLKRLAIAGLIFGAGIGTSACTDGYGYSGVAVGYGGGGYYGDGYGYGDPYGGGYGYGYGGYPSYFGWYGDYYYPGTGIYVYDQYRRPYRWNDGQRRYWEGRRNGWRGDRNFRNDWNGFDRRGQGVRPDGGGAPYGRGDGYRGGDRTPGYRGDGIRGDRGGWRGNRQNFSGQPAVTPQSAVPPSATPQRSPGMGQRSWGGNRGWSGGGREGRGGGRGRR
ncbi:hypothetical protein LPN01_17065 [Sphingomonas sp. A2-49]|uniref:hypothetical protein n=1 Tax=Sphingomonas sp. A2-49 TaxID=1391375 RepID=UPI0021CE70E7|nr:hypothetical protein [Sphingomonas sp. A2-49]MCU6455793.1 hypothetical protein [Sphingomonas sp. A2-49]